MNATPQKHSKRIIDPNIVENDTVLHESTDTKSPTNNAKQLIRTKRKLFSPEDDDNENHDSLRSRKVPRASSSNESPIAACYKELENGQKSRKRARMQPVTSPKTRKLNKKFDKIKDSSNNDEMIVLIQRKGKKYKYLYNLSIESDYEAFNKEKIERDDEAFNKENIKVQVRAISSNSGSSKYTPSSEGCQTVQKPQTVHQTEPKKPNVEEIPRPNLVDEKMRTKQSEVLETSFVQEECDRHVPGITECVASYIDEMAFKMPVLEEIRLDDLTDGPIISENKPVTPKNCEIYKYNDNVDPADLSDVLSEKSRPTCGSLSITGHINQDESPPNLDALYESFQHRDVDMEGKDSPLVKFLDNMRNQVIKGKAAAAAIETSPVLPITQTLRNLRGRLSKQRSVSSTEIPPEKSLRNPVTPSKTSTPRENNREMVFPNHPNITGSSIPNLVVDRVPTDEINKCCPMPPVKEEVVEERAKPCTASGSTHAQIPSTTPPVQLNFNNVDVTTAESESRKDNSVRGIHSQETVNPDTVNRSNQEDLLEISRNLATVQSWLNRNEAAATNTGDTRPQEFYEVMNTFMERLATLNSGADEEFKTFMVETRHQLQSLVEEIGRLKSRVESVETTITRACSLLQTEAEARSKIMEEMKRFI